MTVVVRQWFSESSVFLFLCLSRDSAALGVSNENLWWYLKYNDLDVDVACESYAGMKVRGQTMTMQLVFYLSS